MIGGIFLIPPLVFFGSAIRIYYRIKKLRTQKPGLKIPVTVRKFVRLITAMSEGEGLSWKTMGSYKTVRGCFLRAPSF
jgi:hypothetical protein